MMRGDVNAHSTYKLRCILYFIQSFIATLKGKELRQKYIVCKYSIFLEISYEKIFKRLKKHGQHSFIQ